MKKSGNSKSSEVLKGWTFTLSDTARAYIERKAAANTRGNRSLFVDQHFTALAKAETPGKLDV